VIRSKRNEEIIQRIEYIRNYLGLNKSRFSTEIGLKPQTYNNFIGAQASKPSVELILGIVNRFGVNPGWLLNGSGAVFQERAPEAEGRFAPAPGVPPMRPWTSQVAEGGRPMPWAATSPEAGWTQQMARLEETVGALERRLAAVERPLHPLARDLADLAGRLLDLDKDRAESELVQVRARLSELVQAWSGR
jgi:transcriptional regulator with XRE-family HTH domain